MSFIRYVLKSGSIEQASCKNRYNSISSPLERRINPNVYLIALKKFFICHRAFHFFLVDMIISKLKSRVTNLKGYYQDKKQPKVVWRFVSYEFYLKFVCFSIYNRSAPFTYSYLLACSSNSLAYSPPVLINSACDPCSMICPSLKTIILSARVVFESLWEIVTAPFPSLK